MNNKLLNNIVQKYPGMDREVEQLFRKIDGRPNDAKMLYQTLQRYFNETGGYNAVTTNLTEWLLQQGLIADNNTIVDLGAGPGDLIREIGSRVNVKLIGVDLNPGFVAEFNANSESNSSMQLGLIDSPLDDLKLDGLVSVVSVLTLDRLAMPMQLIQNMSTFSGYKILATLLPVNPVDDNPSRQADPIIYTRFDQKIVPGNNAEEDQRCLRELLSSTWESEIQFSEVDYVVSSAGDSQEYKLGIFTNVLN